MPCWFCEEDFQLLHCRSYLPNITVVSEALHSSAPEDERSSRYLQVRLCLLFKDPKLAVYPFTHPSVFIEFLPCARLCVRLWRYSRQSRHWLCSHETCIPGLICMEFARITLALFMKTANKKSEFILSTSTYPPSSLIQQLVCNCNAWVYFTLLCLFSWRLLACVLAKFSISYYSVIDSSSIFSIKIHTNVV